MAKSRRPSSAASILPVSAGSTSATASLACGYGSNFRHTERQSAIGRIQLQRLPEWTAARTRNALLLAEALGDLPAVWVPLPPEGIEHAWYKFYAS
jgi:dTDP-4-amino-4,6-dideoxygalactose transaminase